MTIEKIQKKISVQSHQVINIIFGEFDENLNIIKKEMNVDIGIGNEEINIFGGPDSVEKAEKLIYYLVEFIGKSRYLDKQDLRYAINLILSGNDEELRDMHKEVITVTSTGKSIKPKTLGQKRYLDSINSNDIVFGIGPAGTGKTYLAMALAVQAFKNKEVNRIILTRPAVEAGENLGFLPGDLKDKVDPYLRPIYDALFEILGFETYERYLEKGLIEVAPLAYMRGRTLDSAYVILDEAQNTTNEQMKMFLTRLGFGSKAIITGDITQVDLPKGKQSGLRTVLNILEDVNGIGIVHLTKNDIVRHPLVQRIIEAYDRYEDKKDI